MTERPEILGLVRQEHPNGTWYGLVIGATPKKLRVTWFARWDACWHWVPGVSQLVFPRDVEILWGQNLP